METINAFAFEVRSTQVRLVVGDSVELKQSPGVVVDNEEEMIV